MSTSLVAPPLRLARRAMSAMSIASDGFTAFDRVSAPEPGRCLHTRAAGHGLNQLQNACDADQLLDYEPGIHYPQVQMQSGATGINTIRIYHNLAEQARDRDPHGMFVRQWLPRSTGCPMSACSSQTMPVLVSVQSGFRIGHDYPPVVDRLQAAREIICGIKARKQRQTEENRIYERHDGRIPARGLLVAPGGRRQAPRFGGLPWGGDTDL